MKTKFVVIFIFYFSFFTSEAQWNQLNNTLNTTNYVGIGTTLDAWANLVVYDPNFARTVIQSENYGTNGSIVQLINGDGTERNITMGVVSPNLSAPWIGANIAKAAVLVTQGSDMGALIFGTRSASPIIIGTSDVEHMRITTEGNIGIGTNDPKSKLSVDGDIRTTEVTVISDVTVPDYVFEPDYILLTLEEVRDFVTTNKHLPEIPNAEQIEKDGIDLGEMNMLLLKKIEELTLYQIQLMEQVKELQSKVETLEN